MKKLTALVFALVALAGYGRSAGATTFYPGMDNAVTDSSMKTLNLAFARPAFGDSVIEPMTGAELKRVTGVYGQVIPGTTGGATWGARSRLHYSKDQPWSADEKYFWIQQKSGTPSKLILDSLGVAKWVDNPALTPYCACLDSVEELRMHPTFPNIAVGWILSKGTAYNKLIWFTLDSCLTKRSWQVAAGKGGEWGWKGEGTISDDGRWTTVGSFYDRSTPALAAANANNEDSLVVIDMMYPHEVPGTGTRGGRVGAFYTVPRLPFTNSSSNGTLGNTNISALGTYVLAHWSNTPQYTRVFHRGTAAGADTSVLTLFPHTMAAKGLRMSEARDSTLGWVAHQSHSDMNLTTSGVEVVVGGMRDQGLGTNQSWNEATTGRDSGKVIMVELATGLHRHVSAGKTFTGHEEHGDNHTSGRAVGMRGWHGITYASLLEGTPRQFADELVMVKLDGDFTTGLPTHSVIRYGTTHTNDQPPDGPVVKKYDREAHGVWSPTGRRVMFNSTWSTACQSCGDNTDVKSYVYDIRTAGRRDFYVKQGATADSGRAGFTSQYPSSRFAKFNRLGSAANGSNIVVNVLPSATPIPDFPNPIHAPLGGKRYYVYGNIANPAAATIGGGGTANLTQSHVSIRGVKIDSDLRLISPAVFDSITNFTLTGRLSILGADRSVIADGTVSGTQLLIGTLSDFTSDKRTTRDSVLRVNFTSLRGGEAMKFGSTASPSPRWVDSLYYAQNRHQMSQNTTLAAWTNDHVMRSSFVGNRWFINGTTKPLDPTIFFRDSCVSNLFRRDTVLAFGKGTQSIAWGYNARGQAALINTSGNSTIDSCYFLMRNGRAIDFPQHAVTSWNIKRTTAVSLGAQAARFGDKSANVGMLGKNYIDHNTFASDYKPTGANTLTELGVVGFWGTRTATDTARFTNNIVYSFRPSGMTTDSVSGAGWNLVDSDTTNGNVSKMRRFFISNWNLYSVYPRKIATGDRSISYLLSSGLNYSNPAGAAWNTLFPGRDMASVYGSPEFDRGGPDSTFGLSTSGSGTAFDPAISALSAAVGRDSAGGDIGAIGSPVAPAVVQSAEDIYTAYQTTGTSVVYVYICNVGQATLTLTQPADNFQVAITMNKLSVAPGDCCEMQMTINNSIAAVADYEFSYVTNEPGTPTRYVRLHVGQGGLPPGGFEP